MSDKKAEGGKPEGEAKVAGNAETAPASGGAKAWLPLIVTIVLMPALAFVTTKFLVLPKVVQARIGSGEAGGHASAGGESSHGESDPEERRTDGEQQALDEELLRQAPGART